MDWCRGPFGWKAAAVALAFVLVLCAATSCHAATRHHRHHVRHVRPVGAPEVPTFWSGTSDVVQEARSQLGNGPIYGRRNLWCARFMNWVLARTGHRGTGSDAAASFARMPATGLHVGAIAVMRHHVGIVSGVTRDGNPVVISGNHGGRVREAVYPRRAVWLFVEAR